MIDVVLATYNGARTLRLMLPRLAALDSPPVAWRLIVVDNGSTDDTRAVLDAYRNAFDLCVLTCPERGKNRALNRALHQLRGDLVVFTDDDVLPDADWLVQFHHVAHEQPEHALFGGMIAPYWVQPPPAWVLQTVDLAVVYALTPAEINTGPIETGWLWGPNLAVRRRVLDAGLRFNEDVGPMPGRYMMGSETDFLRRAERAGFKAWFDQRIRVRHAIRPEQMAFEWIVARGFRYGRQLAARKPLDPGRGRRRWLGVPRWMWRQRIEHAVLGRLYRRIGRPDTAFVHTWQAQMRAGMIHQYRHGNDGG